MAQSWVILGKLLEAVKYVECQRLLRGILRMQTPHSIQLECNDHTHLKPSSDLRV